MVPRVWQGLVTGHNLKAVEPELACEAMSNLLDPDMEFQGLGIDELQVMAARDGGSVLRRGRAMMELGRRASSDPVLLLKVAGLVRSPGNATRRGMRARSACPAPGSAGVRSIRDAQAVSTSLK